MNQRKIDEHLTLQVNTYQNDEKDLDVVQLRDYTVKDDLKELINITYTIKMHLLFCIPLLKNSITKCA